MAIDWDRQARFTRAQERVYRLVTGRRLAPYLRQIYLICTLTHAITQICFPYLVQWFGQQPPDTRLPNMVLFFISLPLTAIGYGLTFWRGFPRYHEWVTFFAMIFSFGVQNMANLLAFENYLGCFFLADLVLVTIAAYTCVSLRLERAIVLALIYGVWMVLTVAHAGPQFHLLAFSGAQFGLIANAIGISVGFQLERIRRRDFLRELALKSEQRRSERLLLSILPKPIASQLKRSPVTIAEEHSAVTVLFADLVDFTRFSASVPPAKVVSVLNVIFTRFDELCREMNVEKIKTIGDAYMAVAGLPFPRSDHAEVMARLAFAMQAVVNGDSIAREAGLRLRIGMNSGPVVAGVIGRGKFSYDLWGDTVNVASRMESQGRPGGIQVTQATYELLQPRFALERRGDLAVKNRGVLLTYWLTGEKEQSLRVA